MRIAWLAIFAVSLASSMAQTAVAPKPLTSLEQALISAEKSLIDAEMKDNRGFFKRTVTPDFALVGVDGNLAERQDAIDQLGDSDLVQLMPYDIKVVAGGGEVAIVTYDAVVRVKPAEDQGPPPRYQHMTSVWVKQGDSWKLKFHQATPAHWGDW